MALNCWKTLWTVNVSGALATRLRDGSTSGRRRVERATMTASVRPGRAKRFLSNRCALAGKKGWRREVLDQFHQENTPGLRRVDQCAQRQERPLLDGRFRHQRVECVLYPVALVFGLSENDAAEQRAQQCAEPFRNGNIPCENQTRETLDHVAPKEIFLSTTRCWSP
jgi:hypothetical protein